MCKPKTPKIEKADPVQAPPPVASAPVAPVLNESSSSADSNGNSAALKRRGRASLTIPLLQSTGSGINIPT
ncbi:hypothetical protein [Ochrobactrum sp. BTU1]|uniref:hypothetical protein n=1 Tax=Ochrobactrum sp. BTU1 TaxID=2840456 RepID=UPI001C0433BF|nr:hypothetical protein KMS41_05065 [Ochrobactrum sp. BTU1]